MVKKAIKLTDEIKEFFENYFKLLEMKVDFSLEEDDKNNIILVRLETDQQITGLIIGSKGRNLMSLQLLLNRIFYEKLEGKRIILDVGDWREKEKMRLSDLAEKTAQRVIESGSPQSLYNLTPSQRKIVHEYLSENDKVLTQSEGEGRDRFLTVTPK